MTRLTSGLPAEFLSTPLGQAFKPQIDAMFRGSNASEHSAISGSPAPQAPTPPPASVSRPDTQALASTFLQAMAAHAAGGVAALNGSSNGVPKSTPETTALTLVTSVANFSSIMSNNKAVIVNFTNTKGCPPCRMIKPAYEAIAEERHATYGPKGTRFVEVEINVGEGQNIASQLSVRATPTFMFFKDGKKVNEVQGADKRGIENATEQLLDDCFPMHPHRRLFLPATERISLMPIAATASPAYAAMMTKLNSFSGASAADKTVIEKEVFPVLEGKSPVTPAFIDKWITATISLLGSLKPAEAFPVIDLWRIGLLNEKVVADITARLSPGSTATQPIGPILSLAARTLKEESTTAPRPLLLTTLRLATNLLASLPLANVILSPDSQSPIHSDLMSVLIDSLLHTEVSVRKAAADVAVNAAVWRHRVAKARAEAGGSDDEDGLEVDWEVELLTALLEGIGRESDADVGELNDASRTYTTGYRLLAASALLIYLSPSYESSVKPLLEVLGAKGTIEEAGKRWAKKDVRKLADEVALKLC